MTSQHQRRRYIVRMLLLLHVPLFAYPTLRLCQWLELSGGVTLLIFLPAFFSQIVMRIFLRGRNAFWCRALRRVSDLWLGVSPILLSTLLVFEAVVWLTDMDRTVAAGWVLGLSLAVMLYGMGLAWFPKVVRVPLRSSKLSAPIRFVQLSDVHIGSRHPRFLDRLMRKITRRLDPHFICITGDFVDTEGLTRRHLQALQRFRGPIYLSIGNHERYIDLAQIESHLTDLGVQVLRDQSVTVQGLQVIGIDDHEDADQVERVLSQISINPEAFVLLLYHRPIGMEAAAKAGVDLMLSGHTHNGQIKPFHWLVKRFFVHLKGLHAYPEMSLYVSSGTGTWGPIMRFGTHSEITLFDISPV